MPSRRTYDDDDEDDDINRKSVHPVCIILHTRDRINFAHSSVSDDGASSTSLGVVVVCTEILQSNNFNV